MRKTWDPKDWVPVGFDSFEDVPMFHRPLDQFDEEVHTIFNCDGVKYFYKKSTDQYWIQYGFDEDEHGRLHCPTDRCNAQCCRESRPWPSVFPFGDVKPCPFLKVEEGPDFNRCGIQGSKFICCISAPDPMNDMRMHDKCEIRCVEVRPRG